MCRSHEKCKSVWYFLYRDKWFRINLPLDPQLYIKYLLKTRMKKWVCVRIRHILTELQKATLVSVNKKALKLLHDGNYTISKIRTGCEFYIFFWHSNILRKYTVGHWLCTKIQKSEKKRMKNYCMTFFLKKGQNLL